MKISRRTVWFSVAGVALSVLAALWFLTHYERVPHEVFPDVSKEVKNNRFYAAQRLLRESGFKLVPTGKNTTDLFSLLPAQGGTVLLPQAREYYMTPARTTRLLEWVAQGGYLMIESGYTSRNDHLLTQLGVKVVTGDAADSLAELERREKRKQRNKNHLLEEDDEDKDTFTTFTTKIPGYGRVLSTQITGHALQTERPFVWGAGDPQRLRILHLAHGRGQITVLDCACHFSNSRIKDNDHAELLLALLHTYQPDGAVIWVQQLEVPSLWQWLASRAQEALIAAALILLFWLWRIIPRFAVIAPEPVSERRSLIEHLRAIGRFLWRSDGLEALLAAAREPVRATLHRRHPALAQLPAAQQAVEIGRLCMLSPQSAALALHAPIERPEQFTEAIRLLKHIEETLIHAR